MERASGFQHRGVFSGNAARAAAREGCSLIEYIFTLNDGRTHTIAIDPLRNVEPRSAANPPSAPADGHADWTALDYQKCPNCPLGKGSPVCPPAFDARATLQFFADIVSCDVLDVRVRTLERDYSKRCDVQTALMSLLGLIMASSACPILSELRAMAVFHLPFSTPEETLYRTVANHLLKQYFAAQRGALPDLRLDKLQALYGEIATVNEYFVKRIRAAAAQDSTLNAIIHLFAVSQIVSASMEDGLRDLERLYPEDATETATRSDG